MVSRDALEGEGCHRGVSRVTANVVARGWKRGAGRRAVRGGQKRVAGLAVTPGVPFAFPPLQEQACG